MSSFPINGQDELTKQLKKQLFIQRANANINKSQNAKGKTKAAASAPAPVFQASISTSLRKKPTEEKQISGTNKNRPYSGSSVVSLREAQLMDRIKNIEEQLGVTEAQIRESEASKQFLKAKLKILEEKVDRRLIKTEPIEDGGEVFQFQQLSCYAKETAERLKKLRELQLRERCVQDSYNKVEELMSSYGSAHGSVQLMLPDKM